VAGRVVSVIAGALALAVALGTVLYIAGVAPPYPLNARAFNLCLFVCLVYALRFGR